MVVDLLLQRACIGFCTRSLPDSAQLAALRVSGAHPGRLTVLAARLALAWAVVARGERRQRLQRSTLAAPFMAGDPRRPSALFCGLPLLLAEARVPSVTGVAGPTP